VTHFERANLNFGIAILAFAASILLFGCAPAIYKNPLFVLLSGGVGHVTVLLAVTNALTGTLTLGAFARALSEFFISRNTYLDQREERRQRAFERISGV
jgi:hypothetical protein